jgi:polyphenol oxidase
MIKNKAGIYQFSSFSLFPELVHGFSTRNSGDMKRWAIQHSLKNVAKSFAIAEDSIVFMDQVHGNRVQQVSSANTGAFLDNTDGIFTTDTHTFLCVRIADCVPLMVYDPLSEICGVAHIGWKGALKNIASRLIEEMDDAGGIGVKNIRAGIGPSIRVCCYSIYKSRARLFEETFSEFAAIILEDRDGAVYLNLPELVKQQLLAKGITPGHIEESNICTKDNSDEFFSYRDTSSRHGLFAGIIGMI